MLERPPKLSPCAAALVRSAPGLRTRGGQLAFNNLILAQRALALLAVARRISPGSKLFDVSRRDIRRPFGSLFLSIGAMKAGTSWLFEMLKDHSEIDTVPIKEVHYLWDRHGAFSMLGLEQRQETVRFHVNALLKSRDSGGSRALLRWCEAYLAEPVDDAWFASLFDRRRTRRYCAEFSNLMSQLGPEAWQHARTLCDSLRVVYTIREPFDRLWSHVSFHAVLNGRAAELPSFSVGEFETFMAQSGCLAQGAYAETIDKLRVSLDSEEWKLLFFDDIQGRPAALVREVEEFLGITPRPIPPEQLAHVHSATEKGAMPPAFVTAARPHVERELEALHRQGTQVPQSWLRAQ